MTSLDNLKKSVLEWSGLPIDGETKEELKKQIKDRVWQMECDLDRQANKFYKEVDSLKIPDF